jgi:hypothetical protein
MVLRIKMAQNTSTPDSQYSDFLQINDEELQLLSHYKDALLVDASGFAEVFYDYLLDFPVTAKVLDDYQKNDGDLNQLATKQIEYLSNLIAGTSQQDYVDIQKNIGLIHYRRGIEPVWVMGAF